MMKKIYADGREYQCKRSKYGEYEVYTRTPNNYQVFVGYFTKEEIKKAEQDDKLF